MHIPNLKTKTTIEGVKGRELDSSSAPICRPAIRNPRNHLLLKRESPSKEGLIRRHSYLNHSILNQDGSPKTTALTTALKEPDGMLSTTTNAAT
eukprot:9417016-Alexandrium_andersonii.AAC.1